MTTYHITIENLYTLEVLEFTRTYSQERYAFLAAYEILRDWQWDIGDCTVRVRPRG